MCVCVCVCARARARARARACVCVVVECGIFFTCLIVSEENTICVHNIPSVQCASMGLCP